MKGVVIDKNSKFVGDLHCKDDAVILGNIKGFVKVQGTVIVEASGTVKGNVESNIIFAIGKIEGNLTAKKAVILKDNCFVKGDISTPSIIIEEKSSHSGKLFFAKK
jgi:cytoskeletal protein CcmA (bactofilin family)